MEENSYKKKYQDLKMQWMESVDVAHRLGIEQGMQMAQIQQVQQEQAMAEQQAQMSAGQGGQEPQPGQEAEEQQQDQQNPMGTELDQHLNELESMLGKSEVSDDDLKKALDKVKSFKQLVEMKKSAEAIKGISKVLHKPAFKIGKQASHQLSNNSKATLSMQEKIINDIFKTWDNKEKKTGSAIEQILEIEGLVKKD